MRALDSTFLKENPPGNERSTVTLSLSLPDAVLVENNPDGTRPAVTFEATGDLHVHVLTGLSELNQKEMLMNLAVELTYLHFDLGEAAATNETVARLAQKLETPFPEHSFTLDLIMDDGKEAEVEIKVTAPSIQTAILAMERMTQSNALTQIAIGMCPTSDDEDEDWDSREVLVRI